MATIKANAINESTTGITGFTGTTFTGSTTTQYNILVGGTTSSSIENIAPSTSGYILTSTGASSNPTFQQASVTPTDYRNVFLFGGM